jgi:FKBP-type peptidyl-prolyl cis-trans isomerase (trigger factor)
MNKTNKSYGEASVKPLAKSQVEITASIPASIWEVFRNDALKNINQTVSIDGFRKGNIPENILIAKVGEMVVLEEMAEMALPKTYMDILIDHKIDAVGQPQISITKLAKGNPLEFKAVTAIVPTIKLPDYRSLAAKEVKKAVKPDLNISDKELDDAIMKIRKMHASHEGHDHQKMTPEEHEKAIMENLPELNDEFVKKIGKFENVADFKKKITEMLVEDKKAVTKEKTRLAIADAIVAEAQIELPEIMIQSELARTQSQFSSDIERMGVKLDDYMKHAKKSIEDLRKEWAPHAEKKAKLQLILNEIAKLDNIKPSPADIEAEVGHITAHYKDADRERAAVYAETVLTNEKVFESLETSK